MSPSFKIGIVNKLFKKLNEDSILHIFDIVKHKNWYSFLKLKVIFYDKHNVKQIKNFSSYVYNHSLATQIEKLKKNGAFKI